MRPLSWVEISRSALIHNVQEFKKLVGNERLFSCTIKANAYGHGLVEVAQIIIENGVNVLDVNSLWEALKLREAGITTPILVLGYTDLKALPESLCYPDISLTVYNEETIDRLGQLTNEQKQTLKIHLKVETGINRQGILVENFAVFLDKIKQYPWLKIEGIYSHFANIEDTTDDSYARYQLERYNAFLRMLEENKLEVPLKHIGNTAATMLYPDTYFDMIRFGIGTYGLWPSMETKLAVYMHHRRELDLRPVLTWKSLVAQIKPVGANEYVGYGCSYRTTAAGKLAIIPVGYYDGYDRGLSNQGYVLIRGQRAPVRGRVCMNMMIVDVSHIPEVQLEDEVVLLGKQGTDSISADIMAGILGTINYEVVTRINEVLPRIVVE